MTPDDETTKPRVVQLGAKNAFQVAVDDLRERMPFMLEHAALVAKIRRASYRALIAEGFTEAQALELCKTA
jgi:hypothetical protein